MADRWTHDRGRSEESQRQRFDSDYGRDRWSAAGGYDYGGGGARGQEERTFRSPDNEHDGDRDGYRSYGTQPRGDRSYGDARVFGERESGADYNRRGYRGDQPGYSSQGGRFQGDPGRTHDRARFGDDNGFGGYQTDYDRRDSYEADRYRGGARDWSAGDSGYSRFGFGFDLDGRGARSGGTETDWRSRERGRHYGRGPEGYKRSDARVSEDIHDRLTDDDDLDASTIQVQVQDGEVTLSGKVANRIDKHRAEHIAESISGVEHVQNNLRVDRSLAQGPHGHLDNDYDRVKAVADGKN